MKLILSIMIVFFIAACRPPVEEVSQAIPNYSLADVQSFAIDLNCMHIDLTDMETDFSDYKIDITELDDEYLQTYCDFLYQQLFDAVQQKFPQWNGLSYTQLRQADLLIKADLEQLYGGNQFLRFFLTFEAGRSMLTMNFTVYKNALLIAQRRLTEITRRIHFEDEKYTNEEAISEDSKIMAGYLADYLENPAVFDKKYKEYWKDYNPH